MIKFEKVKRFQDVDFDGNYLFLCDLFYEPLHIVGLVSFVMRFLLVRPQIVCVLEHFMTYLAFLSAIYIWCIIVVDMVIVKIST